MTGKIYFVSAPGRIKIGFTRKPEARLAQLRYSDMEELEIITIVAGSMFEEGKLHELARDHRIKGEWFTDCPEVRVIMDRFVSGELKFQEQEKVARPRRSISERFRSQLSTLENATVEAKNLAAQIGERAPRKEDVSALLERLDLLTEKIIAPAIHHGRLPEPNAYPHSAPIAR